MAKQKCPTKAYFAYVPNELVIEIRKNKSKPTLLSLQDQIGYFLFLMVRDQQELSEEGMLKRV